MKNGFTKNQKQRYFCHDGQRRSRDDPQPNGYAPEQRAEILRAYEERRSLRGLTRTFGVARNTVTQYYLQINLHSSPNISLFLNPPPLDTPTHERLSHNPRCSAKSES